MNQYSGLNGIWSAINPNYSPESSFRTLSDMQRGVLITKNRYLLSNLYTTQGIIQNYINVGVEDAFRGGIKITSSQLSVEDENEIMNYINENDILGTIKATIRWARLFGGAGIIIDEGLDKREALEPFDIKADKKDICFKSVDVWELGGTNLKGCDNKNLIPVQYEQDYYYYYGIPIHSSRVISFCGLEAPSYLHHHLRGWGMSYLEKTIDAFAGYFKSLIILNKTAEEAKVSVLGIKNLQEGAEEDIKNLLQNNLRGKNVFNTFIKGAEDTFEQVQLTGGGASVDNLKASMERISADTQYPLTKLFGMSASGFNSGQDDIENYNMMVEALIRNPALPLLKKVIDIVSVIVFGEKINDLQVSFAKPLRILTHEQQQQQKNDEFDRLERLYDRGVIEEEEFIQNINKAELTPSAVEDTK